MRLWVLHFLFGISSGLPYLLTGSTLQAWMTEAHVDLKAIGLFVLVRVPYNFKFIWAPFIDKYKLPFLTRRRGWMILIQAFLAGSLLLLGFSDPSVSPFRVALFALLVCFFSASQDIVIDGYRTESLDDPKLGLATSANNTGYRVGMLFGGGMALYILDHFHFAWSGIYALMAALISIGVVAALLAPEAKQSKLIPKNLKEAAIDPFLDFFKRPNALWLTAFILFFKFGDNLAGAMTTPFILSVGYTKTEYALVAKGAGFLAVMVGGFLGGPFMLKLGIIRSLWVFGIGQAVAVAAFAWLAKIPHSVDALSVVIMSENFFIGCGAAAFSAFISSITNKKFSATQFALLTSFMALSSTILSTPSGYLAEKLGWENYFIVCALIAIPGFLLLAKIQYVWREGIPPAPNPEAITTENGEME